MTRFHSEPCAADKLRQEYHAADRRKLTDLLWFQLRAVKLDALFVREYRFHPERLWALDFYAKPLALGIEVHGGIVDEEKRRGRHLRAGGFSRDREKMNAAVELGIRVLEYPGDAVQAGVAIAQIERICRRVPR